MAEDFVDQDGDGYDDYAEAERDPISGGGYFGGSRRMRPVFTRDEDAGENLDGRTPRMQGTNWLIGSLEVAAGVLLAFALFGWEMTWWRGALWAIAIALVPGGIATIAYTHDQRGHQHSVVNLQYEMSRRDEVRMAQQQQPVMVRTPEGDFAMVGNVPYMPMPGPQGEGGTVNQQVNIDGGGGGGGGAARRRNRPDRQEGLLKLWLRSVLGGAPPGWNHWRSKGLLGGESLRQENWSRARNRLIDAGLADTDKQGRLRLLTDDFDRLWAAIAAED